MDRARGTQVSPLEEDQKSGNRVECHAVPRLTSDAIWGIMIETFYSVNSEAKGSWAVNGYRSSTLNMGKRAEWVGTTTMEIGRVGGR